MTKHGSRHNLDWLTEFIQQEHLPVAYQTLATTHFLPVAENLLQQSSRRARPYMIGLNGCQGSGKTTLAKLLIQFFQHQGKQALSLSLDDFYLTRAERQSLAENIHPLLATRGVPGTHDTGLLMSSLKRLEEQHTGFQIPTFNKATDDRHLPAQWHLIDDPVDIVVFEGWCWGTTHQTRQQLQSPVNELETRRDADGRWRHYVNEQLKTRYEPLYSLMNCWLMLEAPGFDCVYSWRLEQEQKLAQTSANTPNKVMTTDEIAEFIQYYQRLTEQTLQTLPARADVVWHLNEHRQIRTCDNRLPTSYQ